MLNIIRQGEPDWQFLVNANFSGIYSFWFNGSLKGDILKHR